MPVTRSQKRDVSPEAEPQSDPPRKKRQNKDATSKTESVKKTERATERLPARADNQTLTSAADQKQQAVKVEVNKVDTDDVAKTGSKKDNEKASEELPTKTMSAQFARSANLLIPADETCILPLNFHVYVDEQRIIYDASLNQTNAGKNNNKFYKIQILTNGSVYHTYTRWGRVGESGANALLGNGYLAQAKGEFSKKFKDKTGLTWDNRLDTPKSGKYTFIERNYEVESDEEEERTIKKAKDEDPPESTLSSQIQDLMAFIFNADYFHATMADMNYDVKKLPLGKLSKNTILSGYKTLKDLETLLDQQASALNIENMSNQFYSYIPHDFGRKKPILIDNKEQLGKELDLLQALTDLKDADAILKTEKHKKSVNIHDTQYQGLGMREMTALEAESNEYRELSNYLTKTRGATHGINYQIIDIFRIEREGERTRFKKIDAGKSDRRLLWHGSRSTNFGGILSQGLRIAPPEAPRSGYAFGKGVYLADMSTKSANYCHHDSSKGQALLLLCEAELGNPALELSWGDSAAREKARDAGMLSTFGKGTTGPSMWKDAGCVHPDLEGIKMPDIDQRLDHYDGTLGGHLLYNEYICYDVAQVQLRYLFRVKM